MSSHSDNFEQFIIGLKTLQDRTATAKQAGLRRLAANIRLIKERSGAKGKMKQYYDTVANLFLSLADGIASGEAKEEEFKACIRETREVKAFALFLEELPQSKNDHKDSPEENLQKIDQENKLVLQKYKAYESMVPSNLGSTKIKAVRVPLVLICSPYLDKDKLKKLKISDDSIVGYPVVKNQLLLGLDDSWVKTDYAGDVYEAAKFALDRVKKKFNKEFMLIDGSVHRGSVMWVWTPSELDFKKLKNTTHTGHLQIKAWSFPFEPEKRTRKRA